MTAAVVSHYLYLLDEAFDGPAWHSLLGNLQPLIPEDWTRIPAGGERSIRDIVQHVGSSKFMYHNHAFGDATLTWDAPLADGGDALATRDSAIKWLREGHQRLRQSIAALDDADWLHPRMTAWGELKETRWIIAVTIQHDLYHAGEINHIRSLLQQHDQLPHTTAVRGVGDGLGRARGQVRRGCCRDLQGQDGHVDSKVGPGGSPARQHR